MSIGKLPLRSTLIASGAGLLFTLSACATDGSTDAGKLPPQSSTEPDCGADALKGYVGREATDEIVAALRAWRGDHPVRVLKPGSIVTMDYRPDRLNIDLEEDGTIKGFRCT